MRQKRAEKATTEPGGEERRPAGKRWKRTVVRIIVGVVLVGVLVDWGFCLQARYWTVTYGFKWDDVEVCLENNPRTLESRCPKCFRHKKKIFFRSPRWTWRKMCGRSGELTVCEHCRLEFDFEQGTIN